MYTQYDSTDKQIHRKRPLLINLGKQFGRCCRTDVLHDSLSYGLLSKNFNSDLLLLFVNN